jgi:hypothetical protein
MRSPQCGDALVEQLSCHGNNVLKARSSHPV